VVPDVAQSGPQPSSGRNPAERRFDHLYQSHFRSVYAYALRRTPSLQDVPDLVSDVFTTAWRRIDRVPEPPQDLLWLYGVARRVLSQHRRARRRRQRLGIRLEASAITTVPSDSESGGPFDLRLIKLIESLRPKDRELVRLIAWEQLSHAQVANVLGCSVNAVAIRWHRSIKFLRNQLGDGVAELSPGLPEVPLHDPRSMEL
jgi:RNA polymerase sigma factor (sigma-70 family)